MVVIGIGAASTAESGEILELIRRAADVAGTRPEVLALLSRSATADAVVRHAALLAGLEAMPFEPEALLPFAPLCRTHPPRSMAAHGVPSVAEALALAGAAAYHSAPKLILPRIGARAATAAMAGGS